MKNRNEKKGFENFGWDEISPHKFWSAKILVTSQNLSLFFCRLFLLKRYLKELEECETVEDFPETLVQHSEQRHVDRSFLRHAHSVGFQFIGEFVFLRR